MSQNPTTKLIAGIPHKLVTCVACKQKVWSSIRQRGPIVCSTCMDTHIPTTGGGVRVVRKGSEMS